MQNMGPLTEKSSSSLLPQWMSVAAPHSTCHVVLTVCTGTHSSAPVGATSLEGTSVHVWMTSSMSFHALPRPHRSFWTPAAFSWEVSPSASTRHRPLSRPRSTASTRCASAPAARSTSPRQRAPPPARPWAISACGADLRAAAVMGNEGRGGLRHLLGRRLEHAAPTAASGLLLKMFEELQPEQLCKIRKYQRTFPQTFYQAPAFIFLLKHLCRRHVTVYKERKQNCPVTNKSPSSEVITFVKLW